MKKEEILEKISKIVGSDVDIKLLYNYEYSNESCTKPVEGFFTAYGDNNTIFEFAFRSLPGNYGVCVSTDSYVYEDYRNKGIGKLANEYRINLAREMGYSQILCTFVSANKLQRKVLKANGWVIKEDVFYNKRTETRISYAYYNL